MKFGRYLNEKRAEMPTEWASHCIDYDTLKLFLKQNVLPAALGSISPGISGSDLADKVTTQLHLMGQHSATFIRRLTDEVSKLNQFYLRECTRLHDQHQQQHRHHQQQNELGETNESAVKHATELLQQTVKLERFVFLNFTGIGKILKKHDKLSGVKLAELYLGSMAGMPFYQSSGLAELKKELIASVSGIPVSTDQAPLVVSSPSDSVPYLGSGAQSPNQSAVDANGQSPATSPSFPPVALLPSQRIIITLSGPHGTDIPGCLLENLAKFDVRIEDLMFSRLYHRVTCAALVQLKSQDVSVFKHLTSGAKKWDAELRFDLYSEQEKLPKSLEDAPYEGRLKYCATVLNQNGLTAGFLSEWTCLLLRYKISIEALKRLNDGRLCVLDMKLSVPKDADFDQFRTDVFQLSSKSGTDIALQPDDIYRRSKRLVVLDMDSTLIQQEVIDEIAKHAGVVSEVAKITHRAMNGEIDFKESLRLRVSLLNGTPTSVLEQVRQSLTFTEGVHFLCRALKKLGYKLAVISGGFIPLANYVKHELGLDYAFANQLKVSPDGKTLMGQTTGPIVDGERKAELLEVIAQAESIAPEQVIAIGDGANDLYMLAAAGLGIAFNAKPKVQEKARTRINQKSLKNVLYLLGHSDDDITRLLE